MNRHFMEEETQMAHTLRKMCFISLVTMKMQIQIKSCHVISTNWKKIKSTFVIKLSRTQSNETYMSCCGHRH